VKRSYSGARAAPEAAEAALFARASAAWREGRTGEATQLLETLVAQAPAHAPALNALGLMAIGGGDARRAIGFLDRAVDAQPRTAAIWFNRFQAQELAGDLVGGLESLDRALAVDPYFVPALLKKAEVLERLGRLDEAVSLYRAIIKASPSLDALPEPARRALSRGVAMVRADDERRAVAVADPLQEVFAAFPAADFTRAKAYLEQRTGRRKVYVQQPVGGHFPYLPAVEFFPRSHFPWLERIEAKTGEICRELLALLEERGRGFRPYVAFAPGEPVNQWAELNHSPRWSAWFLWEDGVRRDQNCARCPATTAALEALPLLDLPEKGPTAMFSVLEPRTRIPPHTGSNNVRTTVHLPLVVPEGCGFRVGAETRAWQVGTAFAFDDTIEHEAWNDSDELRAVLIFDVWNPLLTEAERAAVRVVG
jgi:aspartyl/asparaginyl beta-hydroxylase (cupin superfamily)